MLYKLYKLLEKLQSNLLEDYIVSKNPKTISDIENLEKEYFRRLTCC